MTQAIEGSAIHTAVIGCGNTNRSDDGVGPFIVKLLQSKVDADGVALFDAGTDGMSVMYHARGISRLIIVDAQAVGDNPGAIYEVPGEVLESPPSSSINLHDFRWDNALFAGRQIYGEDFPSDVKVFLVEAENLDLGLDLSASVASSAQLVADQIAGLIAQPVEALL